MDKNGQAAQQSAAVPKEGMLSPDHGETSVEADRPDRALKNALEDDEVREALKLRGRRHGKGF